MKGNVTKLPTATTSYITVRKNRGEWDVILATPAPGKALRTRLYSMSDKDMAYHMGQKTAARLFRPFKAKERTA